VIVASPAYLKRAGVPRAPADLAAHSVIVGPSRLGPAWTFRKDGKATSVRVSGRLASTVNEVATAAAVAGLGIISMSSVGCRRPLPASFLNYNGGEKWAGGLRENVVRDRRAAPICATSLAGVTREVEEEWNQRAAPPLAGDRGSLLR
jgi:hypothetical protein